MTALDIIATIFALLIVVKIVVVPVNLESPNPGGAANLEAVSDIRVLDTGRERGVGCGA
ncbi:MAG: hypothetical protein ACREKR_01455 [Candidatus Methylomirabilales bacterium]